MKKNVLAMSIATMIGGLGFAGIASAETILASDAAFTQIPAPATDLVLGKAGDKGHILVVPYFTAQDGNMSVFHVVNTDTINGKAVKVRFRGASNSDDILDFQLFMSPGDVWTGSVRQGANGNAMLETADTSCTVPRIPAGGASFVVDRLNPAADTANETREGYVELFTMADIPLNAATGSLYSTIKHKTNGAAPDCAQTILESSAGNLSNITSAATARAIGFDTPTGSLFGDWYIINVAQTTTFSGSATVIRAENAPGVLGRGNFVHFPQSATPAGDATAMLNTADPLFRTEWADGTYADVTGAPAIPAAFYDLPDLSTPYTTLVGLTNTAPLSQAGLLTASIATNNVSNQYATAPSISAKTDFVFSMPTRRYSVAYDYEESGRDGLRFSKLYDAAVQLPVGQQWFNSSVVTLSGKQICVTASGQDFYSREEQTVSAGAVFSPGQVSKTTLCGEASVLSIGGSVLGATVAKQSVTPNFTNGWLKVNFGGAGVPVQGFAATKLTNPQANPGVSGNYGITWPHRFIN